MRQMVAHVTGSGSRVMVHWEEVPAGRHPMNGAALGPVQGKAEEMRALVHFIEAKSVVRQMADLVVGDCLIDYPATVTLTGRESLWFEIGGQNWQPKRVSQRTQEVLDALVADRPGLKTMVLEAKK